MCELCPPRRAVLAGVTAAVVAGRAGRAATAATPMPAAGPAVGMPAIVPRSAWGPDLPPVGPIPDEPDVRFLLVHHTVNGNDYGPDDVPGLLAAVYRFHTSPEKGWPDIAYNFLVDRFGTVYEGRTGSLAGPKAADATGGSQGFAQLCCFVGDHSVEPPTPAALDSMVALLAWLGDRHGIDLAPGATATFTSRGSNRRSAGSTVTTPTISGHRDMSATACPGDAAYALVVDGTFARLATAVRSGPATTAPPPTTVPTSTSTSPPPTTAAPTTSGTGTAAPTPTTDVAVGEAEPGSGGGGPSPLLPAAGVVAAAAAGAAVALRRRRLP